MTGTEDLRGQEYTALMEQVRDLGRMAHWTWTGSAIACAVLLSSAIGSRSAGLMFPVVLCAAFGYYGQLASRRRARLVEGFLREFHETDRSGAQWFSRLTQLAALSGPQAPALGMTFVLANLLAVTSIVLAWVFAEGSFRGELMGGFTTVAGIAFSAHSVLERMRDAQPREAEAWSRLTTPLREVTTGERRVSSSH
jgi:hypothetical protein